MPKIAIYKFLTFFIFAFDALNEPPHLHIVKEKGSRQRSAKIWLESLSVADRGSLTDREIAIAIRLMKKHQKVLVDAFNKVKKGNKIKTINLV
ncbi:MAG: DUF4160 domain-containing protein [Ignavibacteriaceae bacterium]|nr:DUF4160 domain-containing protein [Ignavibacteriaceae bacterium]